jgi:Mce-associated membrane protein
MSRRWQILGAVAVLAVAFAAWSGFSLYQAESASNRGYGELREGAVTAARQSVATLTTVRKTSPETDLRRWLDCTTGVMHQDLAKNQAQTLQQLRQASASAVGTVTAAAIQKLDDRSATLLATVSLQIIPDTGSQTSERHRYRVVLSNETGGWKVSLLSAVPGGKD